MSLMLILSNAVTQQHCSESCLVHHHYTGSHLNVEFYHLGEHIVPLKEMHYYSAQGHHSSNISQNLLASLINIADRLKQ